MRADRWTEEEKDLDKNVETHETARYYAKIYPPMELEPSQGTAGPRASAPI